MRSLQMNQMTSRGSNVSSETLDVLLELGMKGCIAMGMMLTHLHWDDLKQ